MTLPPHSPSIQEATPAYGTTTTDSLKIAVLKTDSPNTDAPKTKSKKSAKDTKTTETAVTIVDFEITLAQLAQLVETLEKGELSLEDSLKLFEQGMVLTRLCQMTLQQAEQRVEQVLQQTDAVDIKPLDGVD